VSLGNIDLLVRDGTAILSQERENPRSEALLLLSFVLYGYAGCNSGKAKLLVHPEIEPPSEQAELYFDLVARRQMHEPIAYIIGEKEFMNLDFLVDNRVLVPRPDTETLVEEAIRVINEKKLASFLDVCTGSGCIAVSIAHYCSGIKAFASDISAGALEVASENAKRNGVEVTFFKGDMFEGIDGKYDLIVSNPPYIESETMKSLPPTIRLYEPRLALDGGIDGMDFHKKLARGAKSLLNPGGHLMMEIAWDQGEKVSNLLRKEGYLVYIKKDLAGLDRVVCGALQ
jgi:release factor glutamine methyltransferase